MLVLRQHIDGDPLRGLQHFIMHGLLQHCAVVAVRMGQCMLQSGFILFNNRLGFSFAENVSQLTDLYDLVLGFSIIFNNHPIFFCLCFFIKQLMLYLLALLLLMFVQAVLVVVVVVVVMAVIVIVVGLVIKLPLHMVLYFGVDCPLVQPIHNAHQIVHLVHLPVYPSANPTLRFSIAILCIVIMIVIVIVIVIIVDNPMLVLLCLCCAWPCRIVPLRLLTVSGFVALFSMGHFITNLCEWSFSQYLHDLRRLQTRTLPLVIVITVIATIVIVVVVAVSISLLVVLLLAVAVVLEHPWYWRPLQRHLQEGRAAVRSQAGTLRCAVSPIYCQCMTSLPILQRQCLDVCLVVVNAVVCCVAIRVGLAE